MEISQTAIHESSHAFLALYLNQDVAKVSIVGDEDYSGETFIRRWKSIPKLDQAMILLAGMAADTLKTRQDALECGWYDIEALCDLRLPRVLVEELMHYTASVIEANWETIMSLATELTAAQTLPRKRIRSLYAARSPQRIALPLEIHYITKERLSCTPSTMTYTKPLKTSG